MEMFYAYELAIPVYVVNLSGEPLSPWLIYHSAKVARRKVLLQAA